MKKFILLVLLFSKLSIAEVNNEDLANIDLLINQKKYPEALEAHKRFFEESKTSSGMTGVRLSFALFSWERLANIYPPAKAELQKMSDVRKNTLRSGKGTFNIFMEYNAINNHLGKDQETVETFLIIDKSFPDQAQSYFGVMKETLAQQKRYDLLKKYGMDPILEYEKIRNQREYSLSELRQHRQGLDLTGINSQYEKNLDELIDVATKSGFSEEVIEIKNRSEVYMKGNLLRKYH